MNEERISKYFDMNTISENSEEEITKKFKNDLKEILKKKSEYSNIFINYEMRYSYD